MAIENRSNRAPIRVATSPVHTGAIWSDLEPFDHGCLQASAAVIDNGRAVATGNTVCAQEPDIDPYSISSEIE
jgi:hypothetical protein